VVGGERGFGHRSKARQGFLKIETRQRDGLAVPGYIIEHLCYLVKRGFGGMNNEK